MDGIKVLYWTTLVLTSMTAANFIFMAIGPGPKYNCFNVIRKHFKLNRSHMNVVYGIIGVCILTLLIISLSRVQFE
jgi:hypothetical protein